LLTILVRGSERSATPMLEIGWEVCSPLRDLVPIESITSPSQDKGKGREQVEMDEGKLEKARSPSLTVSEYDGVFYNGDSAFVYDWIDDNHRDSWLDRDVKESDG
jgi:hypothetical protein